MKKRINDRLNKLARGVVILATMHGNKDITVTVNVQPTKEHCWPVVDIPYTLGSDGLNYAVEQLLDKAGDSIVNHSMQIEVTVETMMNEDCKDEGNSWSRCFSAVNRKTFSWNYGSMMEETDDGDTFVSDVLNYINNSAYRMSESRKTFEYRSLEECVADLGISTDDFQFLTHDGKFKPLLVL